MVAVEYYEKGTRTLEPGGNLAAMGGGGGGGGCGPWHTVAFA